MPTRTLPVLLVSATIVLVACGSNATPAVPDEGGKMTMSMKDLVKLGKNYTCTFADIDDEGMRTEGTVYVQGEENFRGTFMTTEKNGTKHDSQILMTNDTSYMWSADEPEGIMMKLEAEDDSFMGTTEIESGDDDMMIEEDEPLELDCKKWSPDSKTFTPPKDRKFVDFNAQMDAMLQGMDGSQCAMCDQMPDEAGKADCREALGC